MEDVDIAAEKVAFASLAPQEEGKGARKRAVNFADTVEEVSCRGRDDKTCFHRGTCGLHSHDGSHFACLSQRMDPLSISG